MGRTEGKKYQLFRVFLVPSFWTGYFPSTSLLPLFQREMAEPHPAWLAWSRLNRRRYDDVVLLCDGLLAQNPYDQARENDGKTEEACENLLLSLCAPTDFMQAAWYLKLRALTMKFWVDDTELEEEGAGDILMDENATTQVPRPGTSILRPQTGQQQGGASQAQKPITSSGRPVTGFARPATSNLRPGTSSTRPMTGTSDVHGALQSGRPGTSRPVTSSGRFVRVGTASMAAQPGGKFLDVEQIDMKKQAMRPWIARALCDYLLHYEKNPRKALELASYGTREAGQGDWWWKERLARGYYQLGLLRDAERQLRNSLHNMDTLVARLQLGKVQLKLDQPRAAEEQYKQGLNVHQGDACLQSAIARVHELLQDIELSAAAYKRVLMKDPSDAEAIASLAATHFYSDQPEVALRYYRRLLQMGANSPELWCNLGLCCFYSSQYDMALGSLHRALSLANDDTLSEIWYNAGQIAVGIGDLGLAYQAFKVALSVDPEHAEATTNLGALEARKGNNEAAKSHFSTAQNLAPHLYEPAYNAALIAFRQGNLEEARRFADASLEAYPDHAESKEVIEQIYLMSSSML